MLFSAAHLLGLPQEAINGMWQPLFSPQVCILLLQPRLFLVNACVVKHSLVEAPEKPVGARNSTASRYIHDGCQECGTHTNVLVVCSSHLDLAMCEAATRGSVYYINWPWSRK